MSAPLSIVIPTLNAATALAGAADILLEGVTDGLVSELIVSDGGSTDDTLVVAKELGAIVIQGRAGRGHQISRGVFAAKSPWVLILHADTHLGPRWTEAARRHMNGETGKAGYFRLRFDADGFVPSFVAGGANLRSKVFGLPYGDQGLLISRRLLKQIDGVPEVPLMEDVILAKKLKGRLVELNATATTSARRYEQSGWTRRIVRNLLTLARFKLGASPDDLVQSYRRR